MFLLSHGTTIVPHGKPQHGLLKHGCKIPHSLHAVRVRKPDLTTSSFCTRAHVCMHSQEKAFTTLRQGAIVLAGPRMMQQLTVMGLQTLFCRMSALQQDLYGFFYDSMPVKVATGRIQSSDTCEKLAVLPAISALKKLCCHPALVSS